MHTTWKLPHYLWNKNWGQYFFNLFSYSWSHWKLKSVKWSSLGASRHVLAKPLECHILASYQMWYCQKLLKNASQIVKICQFLWNPHLVVLKSTTSGFLRFWAIFARNCLKTPKTGSCGFRCYQMWLITKITKSWLFDWHFWAIFGKTTSGSSPKQDNLNLWAVHV